MTRPISFTMKTEVAVQKPETSKKPVTPPSAFQLPFSYLQRHQLNGSIETQNQHFHFLRIMLTSSLQGHQNRKMLSLKAVFHTNVNKIKFLPPNFVASPSFIFNLPLLQ